MLFWALLASGQINMRKIDGWQTLATKPTDHAPGCDPGIDLAACPCTFNLPEIAPRKFQPNSGRQPQERGSSLRL